MLARFLSRGQPKPEVDYPEEVRLLPELVAIQEYQKFLQAFKKENQPKPTFLDWLTNTPVKIINIPDSAQFWIRKQLLLAK